MGAVCAEFTDQIRLPLIGCGELYQRSDAARGWRAVLGRDPEEYDAV